MPRKPRAVVHFTAEPPAGRIKIDGKAPTVSADVSLEPRACGIRAAGKSPKVVAQWRTVPLNPVGRPKKAELDWMVVGRFVDQQRGCLDAAYRAAQRKFPKRNGTPRKLTAIIRYHGEYLKWLRGGGNSE